jgi:hypothetical protein
MPNCRKSAIFAELFGGNLPWIGSAFLGTLDGLAPTADI